MREDWESGSKAEKARRLQLVMNHLLLHGVGLAVGPDCDGVLNIMDGPRDQVRPPPPPPHTHTSPPVLASNTCFAFASKFQHVGCVVLQSRSVFCDVDGRQRQILAACYC